MNRKTRTLIRQAREIGPLLAFTGALMGLLFVGVVVVSWYQEKGHEQGSAIL